MVIEDQRETVAFLSSPSTHAGAAVERIETHASIVFLAGALAWKMKRAVQYDYLDFSTLERRKAMCEAELRINRRAAPELYRRVVPVTRTVDGALALDGSGSPVEWLIEMVRFDQEALFDRLAARGGLHPDLMRALGSVIAQFHAGAEQRPEHGGVAALRWVVDGNASGLMEQGRGTVDEVAVKTLTRDARAAIERHHELLESRRRQGRVRQCHGDLHLRNIVRLEGRPTLFDAVEFNDEIACTDVLYDLAFTLMDLWRRRLPGHANVLWNGYMFETGDFGGIPLMPLYLSCRAAIRAKTSLTAANLQSEADCRDQLRRTAGEYLGMAQRLLAASSAGVIAIGGFSGAGKSTLARAVAPFVGPVPGAVLLRSDEIRKQQCGVGLLDRLGVAGYSEEASQHAYNTIVRRAAAVARGGYGVVADAVFARPCDREHIEQAAAAAGVPFVGLWLEAPASVLIRRSEERHADASDADAHVIRNQITEGTGPLPWPHIDASSTPDEVLEQSLSAIHDRLPQIPASAAASV